MYVSAQSYTCKTGCVSCNQNLRGCSICYRRRVIQITDSSIPTKFECEVELAPENENCELYAFNTVKSSSYCIVCRPGYIYDAPKGICRASTIKDCIAAERIMTDFC